ncbi:hypothetical protein B0H19DRAFT_1084314 [Mycena capillaripes]|nr:hypothetical protein B0H19DRAFT_1084314 [Mycena capillaripes]
MPENETTSMWTVAYSTGWAGDSSHLNTLDYGGSLARNRNQADWAVFTFTGVAVYYMAPRWPYWVTTRLSLDDAASDLVNLTDPTAATEAVGRPETVAYSILWSGTGLENKQHTFIATLGNYIIMDGFMSALLFIFSSRSIRGGQTSLLGTDYGVDSGPIISGF